MHPHPACSSACGGRCEPPGLCARRGLCGRGAGALRAGVAGAPLAAVSGAPPATRVVEANARGRAEGIRPGLSDAEAVVRCPTLVRRPVSAEAEAAARHALLDACLAVSPRIEDVAPGCVHVDLAGLDAALRRRRDARAPPPPSGTRGRTRGPRGDRRHARGRRRGRAGWARAARDRARGRARGAGRGAAGRPRMARGAERDIQAVGAGHARRPRGLATRWGRRASGEIWSRRARPRLRDRSRSVPSMDAAAVWEEAQGLDWEIVTLPGADAGAGARCSSGLCARLAAAHLAMDALDLRLALASGGHHARTMALAAPLTEAAPLVALLALEIERAAARGGDHRRLGQRARSSSPRRARAALASAAARAARPGGGSGAPGAAGRRRQRRGADRRSTRIARMRIRWRRSIRPSPMGSRIPPTSARPERRQPSTDERIAGPLVLRRLRPPRRVTVETHEGRPAWLHGLSNDRAEVVTCAGPWRASGQWWDTDPWARDEWDIALADGTLWRLAHDRITKSWPLDALYD